MRMEGFELTVSRPRVIFKTDSKGNKTEPIEEVTIDLDAEFSSKIIDNMKDILLQRITNRKNRVAATDEFVLKERDYTKDDGIMIGVW